MLTEILIGASIAAGATGIGAGVKGGIDMKSANDKLKEAEDRNNKNQLRLEATNKLSSENMDILGKKEMEVLAEFHNFSLEFEKIKNKPEFKELKIEGFEIPQLSVEEIKKASVGASVLLGGIGGAALGTAGGFAAAGATTAAVMALGTASTGTAIASLSGAAATNATLAALGGGAVAAGGGGVALGTAVLGGATLGVGLLVGGIIFSITGNSLSKKADVAWSQMKENEKKINEICSYLDDVSSIAYQYNEALIKLFDKYLQIYDEMKKIIKKRTRFFNLLKPNYNHFSVKEKTVVKNCVLTVGMLYNMCKVQFILPSESKDDLNKINSDEIMPLITDSERLLTRI